MAAHRVAFDEDAFVGALVAMGVDDDIAGFVWSEMAPYYSEPLKPDPNDRWESTMRIDPGDLEDMTARFWKSQPWPKPTRKNPVMIPQDPSLSEYAQWLQGQRSLHK
jgi:hypothetical protein